MNSQLIIKKAKEIYFQYLVGRSTKISAKGIVIDNKAMNGKVVFAYPLLLPNEYFIGIEHILPGKKRFNATKENSYRKSQQNKGT